MFYLSPTIPKKLITNLFNMYIPKEVSMDKRFELIIRMRAEDIRVRQFAAYLNFIDKAYGRLTPRGIIHYARTSTYELKATEIRQGSLEIVISNILSESTSIRAIIIVGLLLKYLPSIIKSVLSSYRDYEEARLSRIRREQIREQIKKDKDLCKISRRQIYQLAIFLDNMYRADMRDINKAHKFSKENIVKVNFNLREQKKLIKERKETGQIKSSKQEDD
jgi:hypothetical protein